VPKLYFKFKIVAGSVNKLALRDRIRKLLNRRMKTDRGNNALFFVACR